MNEIEEYRTFLNVYPEVVVIVFANLAYSYTTFLDNEFFNSSTFCFALTISYAEIIE